MAEENLSVGAGFTGMFNAFVDPQGLAKRVPAKLSWLWPLIVVSAIYVFFGYLMLPYTLQLIDTQMSQRAAQQGASAEQLERMRSFAHMFGSIGIPLTPIFVVAILALLSWLVTVVGSVVGLRAKFRDVFSIGAACSLITMLQYVAGYIVIRAKGDEITSAEQMTPPFGLDIFFQDVHGPLLAVMNFFSIFTIWHLVIFGLTLAYVSGSSKGKAFIALTPAWVIPLLFRVVGSLFNRGAGG